MAEKKSTKNKKRKVVNPVKRTFAVIGTTILSLVLIAIITASIVATALTVYVMQFMDEAVDIDLYNLEMNSTSFFYANDKNGNEVEIKRMSQDSNRIILTLDEIPQMIQDAFVYTEDERFFQHQGVDFKRTFAAFANMFLHFYDTNQGGSTITQQLVKNITGDNDNDPSRKIREIFRAMKLEDYYSKADILEAYLNYIGMGGNTCGVQAAANKYYGKDVTELSLAEAASIASIPKNPEVINPHANAKKNKERQEVVLSLMYKNGAISKEEYDNAVKEELVIVDGKQIVTTDEETGETIVKPNIQSYFVDAAINEVAKDLMELYGLENMDAARTKLANSGYKIHTTVDLDMQSKVEEKFLNPLTFSATIINNPPESAFVCIDYKGNIQAVVGGIGEKPGDLCWNRATMSKRSVGSSIKPISTYGYGLSMDMYHWSTIFQDTPIKVKDNITKKMFSWPKNYSNVWTGNNYFTFQALQRSLNTVPAQLCEQATPAAVFNFVRNNMKISSLVSADADYSPMVVGGLTEGISLLELVSSYQAFGNLGKIYEPTTYTKVVDSDGKVILEHKYIASQALDENSAYVMNKLMQTVIEGPNGTGTAARLTNKPLIGKTGTSQDWADLSFVGCTPNYVSGIWYGYDDVYDKNGKVNSTQNTYLSSAKVWKNIFGDIADNAPEAQFPDNPKVREERFCSITGLLSNTSCPVFNLPGYYKPSNVPSRCSQKHSSAPPVPAVTTPPDATVTTPDAAAVTTPPAASVTPPPTETDATTTPKNIPDAIV